MHNPASERTITFTQALHEALHQILEKHDESYVIGLGVPDPKGTFGTTLGLQQRFGSNRVFDSPVSENAVTGIAIGTAIMGMRPIITHQRFDFALMSMDQIVNNAAKWFYMYGGVRSVPLVIRVVVGRGWGQGPQHSQNLQAMFATIPGLTVVAPATPYEAKGLLIASVESPNPVIFIEHRWLANQLGHVPPEYYSLEIGKAQLVKEGDSITVIASMELLLESMKAVEYLEQFGVHADLINLSSIKPLDMDLIVRSTSKTKHLLVIDSSWLSYGISAEIVSRVVESVPLKSVKRLGLLDVPTPTSPALSKDYYPNATSIAKAIAEMLKIEVAEDELQQAFHTSTPHDIPGNNFKGPF